MVEKTSIQRGWTPGPRLSSPGERERNADGHKSGWSICCSSVRSPAPSHTHRFQIKWEAYHFLKKSSLVFIVPSLLYRRVLHPYEYTTYEKSKSSQIHLFHAINLDKSPNLFLLSRVRGLRIRPLHPLLRGYPPQKNGILGLTWNWVVRLQFWGSGVDSTISL